VNAVASLQYGDGLLITCTDNTAILNHVVVDGAVFSQVKWYSLQHCNFVARWIIDITGTGNIVIQGGAFPGIVERVIYNIMGSGRTISTTNGVAGHVFAPNNIFSQPAGVTYGLVIAGDIPIAKQQNKPNCQNFNPVTVTTKLKQAIQSGDTIIYVVDYPDFIVGDLICINSDCRKIVGPVAVPNNKRDATGAGLKVDGPFTARHSVDDFVTASVTDFSNRQAMNYPSEPETSVQWGSENGAATLLFSVAAFAAVLLM